MKLGSVLVALLGVVSVATPASAHIMPAGQGSSRIDRNHAYTMIALPVSLVRGWDDDHDGRMSDAEARAHGDDIGAQLRSMVHLYDGSQPETIILQNFLLEQPGDTLLKTFSTLTLVRISEWKEPIKTLRIVADVFPAGTKDSILFRGVRDDSTEIVYLKAGASTHTFFTPRMMPGQTVKLLLILAAGSLALGTAHVLITKRQKLAPAS